MSNLIAHHHMPCHTRSRSNKVLSTPAGVLTCWHRHSSCLSFLSPPTTTSIQVPDQTFCQATPLITTPNIDQTTVWVPHPVPIHWLKHFMCLGPSPSLTTHP